MVYRDEHGVWNGVRWSGERASLLPLGEKLEQEITMKIHREDTAIVFTDPPHRVFGPETNDLVLQLRKRKISKIILGGMLANSASLTPKRTGRPESFEVGIVFRG